MWPPFLALEQPQSSHPHVTMPGPSGACAGNGSDTTTSPVANSASFTYWNARTDLATGRAMNAIEMSEL